MSRYHVPAVIFFAFTALAALTGCNNFDHSVPGLISQTPADAEDQARAKPSFKSPSPSPTPTISLTPTTAPPSPSTAKIDAMIYNGTGASPYNVQALVEIVQAHGMSYQLVDHNRLNAMSITDITSHGMIIWPGGNSNHVSDALTGAARTRVRQAVRTYGVNFAGFCAGAWMAVGPDPGTKDPIWGFSIVTGDYLKYYYPGGQYPKAAIVPTTFAQGNTRHLVWWDGPYLPALPQGVIAKYPEGQAALGQTWAGNGFVTLSALHPEAPQSWRDAERLSDPDGLDTETAWQLIDAARRRTPMQTL